MSNSNSNWFSEFQAQEQRERDRLPAAKATLLTALKARRAAIVTIEYDGEGDNGQINAIVAKSAAGKPIKLRGKVSLDLNGQTQEYKTLEEAIDDFAWAVLRAYHGGYENDDGGYGTITIAVADATVTLDHNDRFTDSVNTQTEV